MIYVVAKEMEVQVYRFYVSWIVVGFMSWQVCVK